jgi:DNA-binding beta-propeller fold protein YncE
MAADAKSWCNGVAVTRDGCTLLVSDDRSFTHANSIRAFSIANGASGRVVGCHGTQPLQFVCPQQVWVASDGVVFVADFGNRRVQLLSPDLSFLGVIGAGQLDGPLGVCANADIVVVSELESHRLSVFNRGDGALRARFGCRGSGDGQLCFPVGLCFTSHDRHVAVADSENDRVSVFSVDGDFIRHVGVGVLGHAQSVACSAFDELVVADRSGGCLRVFSDGGDLLMTIGEGDFSGVAIHGTTVYATDDGAMVVLS